MIPGVVCSVIRKFSDLRNFQDAAAIANAPMVGESSVGIDLLARLSEALGIEPVTLLAGAAIKSPGIEAVRLTIKQKAARLSARDNSQALQALAVVMGLVDNALARQAP